MEKKGNNQTFVIAMLSIAIVVMSVGFALSDIDISLTGDTTIKSSSWKVQFQEDSFTSNTGSETATNVVVGETTVTYDIVLSEVGDIFDYDIVVENLGSFNAKLKTITLTDISSHADYLSFEVNYNNKKYTNPTNTIAAGDANVLNAKTGTETINLRAEYLKPSDATKLPSEDKEITMTVTLVYGEA